VEGGLLLDVVVGQSTAVLELLSSEDESLLIWGNSFLVLDLLLDVVDGVRALNLEGDGLSSEGLDEDLHASPQTQHQMEGGLLLDVVVGQSTAVLELLSSEDESLLIWGNSLLILDLLLDVVDGIGALDLEGDGLSSEGLDEDLHSTSQSEDQMEGGLLLNVVVGQSTAVLELLSSEDESLLIRGNSLLVLDLLLDVVDGIGALDFESDGSASQCLDEDLHATATSQAKHQMDS